MQLQSLEHGSPVELEWLELTEATMDGAPPAAAVE